KAPSQNGFLYLLQPSPRVTFIENPPARLRGFLARVSIAIARAPKTRQADTNSNKSEPPQQTGAVTARLDDRGMGHAELTGYITYSPPFRQLTENDLFHRLKARPQPCHRLA